MAAIAAVHKIPVPWAAGQKDVGFIDRSGKMIIPAQFDDAQGFSNGLAPVCLNGKWGAVDKSGKLAVALDWGKLERFSEGLAAAAWIARDRLGKDKEEDEGGFLDPPAFKLDGWTFLDTLGQPMVDRNNSYREAGSYSEGLAAVRARSEGYIDRTGKMVFRISPLNVVDSLGPFRGGLATICMISVEEAGYKTRADDLRMGCRVFDKGGRRIWAPSKSF